MQHSSIKVLPLCGQTGGRGPGMTTCPTPKAPATPLYGRMVSQTGTNVKGICHKFKKILVEKPVMG